MTAVGHLQTQSESKVYLPFRVNSPAKTPTGKQKLCCQRLGDMDYYLVDLLRESFPICNSSSGSPQEDSFEASDIDQCRDEEEDQINAGRIKIMKSSATTGY